MITRNFRISKPHHYILFFVGLICVFLFQRLKDHSGIQSVDFLIQSVAFLLFLTSFDLLWIQIPFKFAPLSNRMQKFL